MWDSLKQRLYKPEVTHVKRLVGKDLICQNRALWDELNSLRQIMTEFEQQNDSLLHAKQFRLQLCGTPHRDLLRRQLRLLCEDLRAQAAVGGVAAEDWVPELKDKLLQDFLGSGGGGGGCPDLASQRPSTPSTRPPSSCGGVSGCTTPDGGGGLPPLPLGRPLRVSELGGVADGIREAIEEENESLLALIGEQMQRFEAEDERRQCAERAGAQAEPSTSELQQLAKKLQDVVVSPSLRSLAVAASATSTIGVEPEGVSAPSIAAGAGAGGRGGGAGDLVVPLPVGGAAHVRRLRALIAQRRGTAAAVGGRPPVPTGPAQAAGLPGASGPLGLAAAGPATAAAKLGIDPFFDDPFA